MDWLQGFFFLLRSFTQFHSLSGTLDSSRSNAEAVIIACHVPILPQSAIPSCMLWNFQDVLDLIQKHNNACASRHGRIVSIFSGHFHGGRTLCDNGILYVSLKSPLLSPNAYYSVRSPTVQPPSLAPSSSIRWSFMRITCEFFHPLVPLMSATSSSLHDTLSSAAFLAECQACTIKFYVA
jgi:hypothetical protein